MRAAVASGEVTARALLDAHVARCEAVNPKIHAVIKLDLDRARQAADGVDRAVLAGVSLADKPLLGVPMTVKDNFDVAGMTTTMGMPWLRTNLATHDATLVARLRAAGAILWGKTNVPFASYDWQTTSLTEPRANNPRDLRFGPGGSSGGSAAALAAGITPLELGSDVAGSVRNPASACGVVGLRPSEGLLGSTGHGRMPGATHSLRSLATPSPMARCIGDLRLALTVMMGPDAHDLRSPGSGIPGPARSQAAGLRIGWFDRVGEIGPGPEVAQAFAQTVATLASAGVVLERADLGPAIDLEATNWAWGIIQGFEMRQGAPFLLRAGPLNGLIGRAYYAARYRGEFGRSVGRGWTAWPITYFRALDVRDESAARADAFFAQFDAWICPVWPITALPHQRTGSPVRVGDRSVPYGDALGCYTVPTAALGTPAVVLPVANSEAGLPIGIQVFARRWHDEDLLAIAEVFEGLFGGAWPTCDP